MCAQRDPEQWRLEFKIGDVLDPADKHARYLARLSMALGDLRVAAATYAVREDQPMYERLYFVRLTASHLHELCILFTTGNEAIPRIDEFVETVVEASDEQQAEALRGAHKRVRQALQREVDVPGRPKLSAELRRLRNDFFHYFYNVDDEARLQRAMELASDVESAYVVRERTMRAEYADEIANKLVHPWAALPDGDWEKAVRALHESITALIDPVSKFLHLAEAAYIGAHVPERVRVIQRA
jgi:hypothetical protein